MLATSDTATTPNVVALVTPFLVPLVPLLWTAISQLSRTAVRTKELEHLTAVVKFWQERAKTVEAAKLTDEPDMLGKVKKAIDTAAEAADQLFPPVETEIKKSRGKLHWVKRWFLFYWPSSIGAKNTGATTVMRVFYWLLVLADIVCTVLVAYWLLGLTELKVQTPPFVDSILVGLAGRTPRRHAVALLTYLPLLTVIYWKVTVEVETSKVQDGSSK